MMTRSLFCIVAVGILVAAGCGGSAETVRPDPYALSERALYAAADRLTTPASDSVQAVRRSRYAAQRMREAGLMPAFDQSFFDFFESGGVKPSDPARAHVLGYIPGRNPSHAGRLVMIAADLDTPAAAAALETARRLALEALDTQVPERTVLVALWAPPHTGSVGLADYLAHPTWALEGIDHVLLVTADSSTAQQAQVLLNTHGIGSERLETPRLITRPSSGQAPETRANEARVQATFVTFAESLYVKARSLALVPDSSGYAVEGR